MITTKILELVNSALNQAQFVANGSINICPHGKHPFECKFYTTVKCDIHS